MMELDEDESVEMQSDSQPASATHYRNLSLLFRVAEWAEPNQGVKWGWSAWKDTMYVENSEKKKQMDTFLLVTEVNTGAG